MPGRGHQRGGPPERARLFHALADSSRLALLDCLCRGPAAVGELAARAGLGQSNTSNHLAVLTGCGLVTRERQGRQVIYSLARPEVDGILRLAEAMVGMPREDQAAPASPAER